MNDQIVFLVFIKWPGEDPVFKAVYSEESFNHWCQQNNYAGKADPELLRKFIIYESKVE